MNHSPERPPRRPRRLRRLRRRTVAVLVTVALLLSVPGVSFARAMTYPGSAPASVRAVEWVRDNGGGGLVDAVESWWYTRNPPPSTGTPQGFSASGPATVAGGTHTTLPVVTTPTPPLSGEGVWRPVTRSATGVPTLYTSWVRPDPAHPTVAVAAALMPSAVDKVTLMPGTREPVPDATPAGRAMVPTGQLDSLVAVFNAGFKMRDTGGGWYANGREMLPLRPGFASLVVHSDGHATVEAWKGGSSWNTDVVGVRQNLHLVVDGGHPVAGLASANQKLFGTGSNQFQYTWRSGIGTTANGDLVYVAGKTLTLDTLARGMAAAGVVTGMELDIHTHMAAFNYFTSAAEARSGHGTHLLSSMDVPANRYLVPDQRDFFTVTAR